MPAAPTLLPGECGADQNRVTVSWRAATLPLAPAVLGYTLELCEGGTDADYRVCYTVSILSSNGIFKLYLFHVYSFFKNTSCI